MKNNKDLSSTGRRLETALLVKAFKFGLLVRSWVSQKIFKKISLACGLSGRTTFTQRRKQIKQIMEGKDYHE